MSNKQEPSIENKEQGTRKRKLNVVSKEEWLSRRRDLLKKEKELTALQDEVAAQRAALPWESVPENYVFETSCGPVSLAELFGDNDQLVVYHFMFSPEWEEGCKSCSFVTDHLNSTVPHLNARGVSLVAVGRAPIAKLELFKERLKWHNVKFVSSEKSSFNYDYGVSFSEEDKSKNQMFYNYKMASHCMTDAPGMSVFYKDEDGNIFHTYSTYGRGLDRFISTYQVLDSVPKGRDEEGLAFTMEWLRHNDSY